MFLLTQLFLWEGKLSPSNPTIFVKGLNHAGLDESQVKIKIAGRNINNLWYADDTTLMAESEEELKSLLMRVIEWKTWLETQHSKN